MKLTVLADTFRREGGEVFIGDAAWEHLEASAGETMSTFLELYVRGPLQTLLREGTGPLLDFRATLRGEQIEIGIGEETMPIARTPAVPEEGEDEMPDDADDIIPGA